MQLALLTAIFVYCVGVIAFIIIDNYDDGRDE